MAFMESENKVFTADSHLVRNSDSVSSAENRSFSRSQMRLPGCPLSVRAVR